jgi:hypothetical protein
LTDGQSSGAELLLDRFMPRFDLSLVHAAVYRASPPACYEAVLALDVFESSVIRTIIEARGVPARLAELRPGHRAEVRAGRPTYRLGEMSQHGWLQLGETPDVEMVLGMIARPWTRGTTPSTPVRPETFRGFAEPGFAKISTSFRVTPYGRTSTILTTETRVVLTDPESRRQFFRYWRVVGPFSNLIRRKALRMLDRRLNRPTA